MNETKMESTCFVADFEPIFVDQKRVQTDDGIEGVDGPNHDVISDRVAVS